MDRLAAGGVRFARSYCASPVCGPSRASMINGLPPHAHGLIHNAPDQWYRDELPGRLPSLADHLKGAGYSAYWVGKWHASEHYPGEEKDLHGFHYLPIEEKGPRSVGVVVDSQVSDRAVQFLESAPDMPWFLGVSWINPHDICYYCSSEHLDKLLPVTEHGEFPALPANFMASESEPEFVRIVTRNKTRYGGEVQYARMWSETEWRHYLRAYDRLTEAVDAELGRVLDALDKAGLAENTLVVFTSDHGEGMAGHGLVAKLTPYEEVVGVPLIARLPGRIPAGTVCETHLASGLDLLPTFCDFAGGILPPELPGRSMRAQMEDPRFAGRGWAIIELDTDPTRPDLTARIVVTERFKYIAYSAGEPAEALYDLVADPGECHDVSSHPSMAAELGRHRGLLDEWIRDTKDPVCRSARVLSDS